MATWQEIGVDNFRAGRELFDAKRYRSSVSRFYYAVFSVLTHELLLTSFQPKEEREAPDHAHMPEWIKTYLTKYTLRQRTDMAAAVRRLYESRLAADYRLRTVDELTAREARRDAVLVFTENARKAPGFRIHYLATGMDSASSFLRRQNLSAVSMSRLFIFRLYWGVM